MKLSCLVDKLPGATAKGSVEIEITDIAFHTRNVAQGSLFVAMPGTKDDGRSYIPQAIVKGAKAVVFEGSFFDNLEATQIRVSGVRSVLAALSARWFNHPTEKMYVCGVTGTNGKTSLTYMMEALWFSEGWKTGVSGTINTHYNQTVVPASHTTPESRILQEMFSHMLQAAVSHVALEVSSHALMQHRTDCIDFDSAVFTNLTQDHLDYHSSMEDYYLAKESLFTKILPASLKKNRMAVIEIDDVYGQRLFQKIKNASLEVVSYGFDDKADYVIKKFSYSPKGMEAKVVGLEGEINFSTQLLGKFNLLNLLAAFLVARHSGVKEDKILQVISTMPSVPGRLERIPDRGGRYIFVDYAHTPDALKNVLETLKELPHKKIITVFGCGGDRDTKKRPLMGLEVGNLSDICLVTSDNPRTENPQKIIDDVMKGLKKSGQKEIKDKKGYVIKLDRRQALQMALDISDPGDIILVAGKGHEDYQIVGDKKFPFSDQKILKEMLGK